jgi:hypothetical protein
MIRYENDCVDCATDGYPCNPFCPRKRAKHCYCDVCGNEDKLYWFNDRQLCLFCLEDETGDENPERVPV